MTVARPLKKIHGKSRKSVRKKYNSSAICHNIFLFIVRLLLVMIKYNFNLYLYYNWSKLYTLVKMVFPCRLKYTMLLQFYHVKELKWQRKGTTYNGYTMILYAWYGPYPYAAILFLFDNNMGYVQ